MELALFYIVILLANIIQGITGFAGTILAMPFSLKLVGMDTAVPVLNALGLLSGIYVFAGNFRHVDKKELLRVAAVMIPTLLIGMWIRRRLAGSPRLLYVILGVLVIVIGIMGLVSTLGGRSSETGGKGPQKASPGASAEIPQFLLLAAAGLVHGMFVCGGPLLIGYLTGRIKEKTAFRATISTVWIFLNGIMLITQIAAGQWNMQLLKVQLISVPFLLAGMFLGGLLYKRMSQRVFMIITYVLLLIAGATLFFK